ncbi:hypothetical protein EDD21DRAFT_386550, partial [Dissophora ornata]
GFNDEEYVDWETPSVSPPYSPPTVHENSAEPEGTQTGDQTRRKRSRTALQLQEKLKIIAFWEQNPISFPALGEHFGLSRTTVYGIIKNKKASWDLERARPRAALTLETSRMVESRFRVLEELLMSWFTDLRCRGVSVSGKKITTQAFEIHRTLSGVLVEPLPPCLFTSGWLKGFKKRRNVCLETMRDDKVNEKKIPEVRILKLYLQCYHTDDIYFCDVMSMFLSMLPSGAVQNKQKQTTPSRRDQNSVSVLLCSNASGTDKREPLVLVREMEADNPELDSHTDAANDTRIEDLTCSTFQNWLIELDSSLGRRILLVMDDSMWSVLNIGRKPPSFLLRFIKVVIVPNRIGALLPMSARLITEFKLQYHRLLLKNWKNTMVVDSCGPEASSSFSPSLPHDVCLRLLPKAWLRVQALIIQDCYRNILTLFDCSGVAQCKETIRQPSPSLTSEESTEYKLRVALKAAIPDIRESVLRYYLTQDRDMGPTSFLRRQILAMQQRQDFMGFFGNVNFGKVKFGSREPSGLHVQGFQTLSQKMITYQWIAGTPEGEMNIDDMSVMLSEGISALQLELL